MHWGSRRQPHQEGSQLGMNRLREWLKAIGRWLWEARIVWFGLLVLAIAVLVPFTLGVTERGFRVSGLVLQVLGIGTVAKGLRDTRSLFGHPPFTRVAKEWLARFPLYGRARTIHGSAAAAAAAVLSGRLRVWMPVNPGDPLEIRVVALMRNTERLRDELYHLQGEVESHRAAYEEALRRESDHRTEGDRRIDAKLEEVHTGGVYLSLLGVVWLLVGVTFATIPDVLAP